MDLVERYIEAVKFWLPAAMKDDVAAELKEDICSEIDEAEKEKGRPLSADEVAALLKARGAPLAVASKYLPQRSLIGPELYPLYIFVLKIVAAVCFIPPLIALVAFAFNPETPLASVWSSPINSLLVSFAIVTVIFAVIEHRGISPAKLASFNPATLPPVLNTRRIQRGQSVGDIIGGLIVIGFFLAGYLSITTYAVPPSIVITDGHIVLQQTLRGHITVSPEWTLYWQMVVLIAAAEITFAAANLIKPAWTFPRILVRMVLDLSKAAVICWLFSSHLLREFVVEGLPPNAVAGLFRVSDLAAQFAKAAGVVVGFIVVVTAIRRLMRNRMQLAMA